MIRQTSIDAFNTIKENGMLGEMEWDAYRIMYEHGPMTAGEGAQLSKQTRNDFASILTRLRKKRVMQEVGVRKCSVTGMEVILWDVTDGLPHKVKLKKKQNIHEAIKILETVDIFLRNSRIPGSIPIINKIESFLQPDLFGGIS